MAVIERLWRTSGLVRAAVLRHVALLVATLAAYGLREQLLVSRAVLWVFALAGFLNVAMAYLARLPTAARWARWASVALGLGAWSTLIALTGGAASPFIAGLWLEILFSAALFSAAEIVAVTGLALGALGLQQALRSSYSLPLHLWVQAPFLVALGAVTASITHHWTERQMESSRHAARLGERLGALESELDEARLLGQVGEQAARQAHLMKSTVYSLRGFVKMIEEPYSASELRQRCLDEIQHTIDRLESMVRENLRAGGRGSEAVQENALARTTSLELQRTLGDITQQVALCHPGVRLHPPPAVDLPSIAFPTSGLREVLLVLVENAAQAAGPSGSVSIGLGSAGERVALTVEDDGPGLGSLLPEDLFHWGATTKISGNGVGLFLSKRLVESFGGELSAAARAKGGMSFSLSLRAHRG